MNKLKKAQPQMKTTKDEKGKAYPPAKRDTSKRAASPVRTALAIDDKTSSSNKSDDSGDEDEDSDHGTANDCDECCGCAGKRRDGKRCRECVCGMDDSAQCMICREPLCSDCLERQCPKCKKFACMNCVKTKSKNCTPCATAYVPYDDFTNKDDKVNDKVDDKDEKHIKDSEIDDDPFGLGCGSCTGCGGKLAGGKTCDACVCVLPDGHFCRECDEPLCDKCCTRSFQCPGCKKLLCTDCLNDETAQCAECKMHHSAFSASKSVASITVSGQ